MKQLKKYFKLTFCFLAFAIMSIVFAFSPVLTTYAAELSYTIETYNAAINSIKMPKTTVDVSKGETLQIPLLNTALSGGKTSGLFADTATNYTIRVVDPSGQTYDYVVGGSGNDTEYFDETNIASGYLGLNALNNGQYDILYIITNGGRTYYSNTYTVTVKNISYELDFVDETTGLKNLVPLSMHTSNEAFEVPVANVKVADSDNDEVVTTVIPTVTVNGAPQEWSTSDYIYESEGKYYVIPSESGTITLEYTYKQGSNPPTVTYTINVSDDFVEPTSDDLTITTPSMPSVELGDKGVTLPNLTVSDNYNSNIEHNVTSITITKRNNENITKTLTNNTFTFNFTKEDFNVDNYTDMVGDYRVIYNIEDAYGNTKSISVIIRNVTDNTRPSVYMAYDYEIDETTKNPIQVENDDGEFVDKVNTNYAVDLKTRYGYTELKLPAIYATDKVTEYKDFEFIRYIQNTNTHTIYYVDNKKIVDGEVEEVQEGESGYNYSADPNIGKVNKAVRFQFSKDNSDISDYAGEYTIGYYVLANTISKQESYVYRTGTTRYTITVLSRATVAQPNEGDEDEDIKTSTPTIQINNVKNNATISSDDTINVNITSTDDIDTRLKNAVFYYYSTESENDLNTDILNAIKAVTGNSNSDTANNICNVLDDKSFIEEMQKLYSGFGIANIDADNENSFDIKLDNYSSETNGNKLNLIAVALNDEGYIATATRVLNIKITDETNAPEYSIINAGDFSTDSSSILETLEFDQVEDVTLPTIKFADTEDQYLALDVNYYIGTPDSVGTGLQFLSPKGAQMGADTITGGTITTSKVGTYYVVYTATDDAGNQTTVFFTFVVNNSSDPYLSVNADGTNVDGSNISISGNTITADLGATISFDPSLYSSNGDDITNDAQTIFDQPIVDTGSLNLSYKTTGNYMEYQFNSEGNYTITFTARYTEDGTPVERIYNVNITMPELEWDFDIDVPEYAKQNETIILPDWTASQGNIRAEVTVTVTDPDGLVPEAGNAIKVQNGSAMIWTFKTNENTRGTYRVTYTAKTDYSTISETFEIRVGDNVAPTFTMNYENELSQEIVYDGTNQIEYNINLDKSDRTLVIEVISNGNRIYSYDTSLVIKDKNDNGTETTMTNWNSLTAELSSDAGIVSDGEEDGQYIISGTGKCVLTLTIEDNYENVATKTIEFNVVSESQPDEENDSYIGIILIVVSLVILAGVILFFTFTGKKGGSSKTKSNKKDSIEKSSKSSKSSKNSIEKEDSGEDKDDEIVIEDSDKTDDSSSDAKSKDVE